MSSDAKRILDVGQCGIDGPRIARFLTSEFHCTIDRAHSHEEAVAKAAAGNYDLVLVNRILARTGEPGLDVIAALRDGNPDLQVMLVSNYDDAQEKAVQLGALKGFGKAALDSEETEKILREVLGHARPAGHSRVK
jgi:DNA-binding NarL/FixJ family response regulator